MSIKTHTGITTQFFGVGQGPILLDNVNCLGVESSILECSYDSHTSDCTHYQDAGVVCIPCKFLYMTQLQNLIDHMLFCITQ